MYVFDNPVNYIDPWGFWTINGDKGYLEAVVERDDDLWTLGKQLLGPNAKNSEIANFVDKIKTENNWDDPSMIYVGNEFKIPNGITDQLDFMNKYLDKQVKTYNVNIKSCKADETEMDSLCSKYPNIPKQYGITVNECKEHNWGDQLCSLEHNRKDNNCWGTSLYIALDLSDIENECKDIGDKYVGQIEADQYLDNYFQKVTDKSTLQIGDIIRYEKDNELTHFATFLIESNTGEKYAFSKSGSGGEYEVKIDEKIHPTIYGPPVGYYRKTNSDCMPNSE
jgi:hypothetical protein